MNKRIVETNPEIVSISTCATCVHKYKYESGCPAFKEIPDSILMGENKHTRPLKNQDNDIVYAKK